MSTPRDSHADAAVWRSACNPSSGAAGQFRFPDFFTLNVAVERKFNFKGYRWAARIGLNDITDRQNATTVDNNVNSPTFLTFFGQSHRTLEGRIRFLGKAVK